MHSERCKSDTSASRIAQSTFPPSSSQPVPFYPQKLRLNPTTGHARGSPIIASTDRSSVKLAPFTPPRWSGLNSGTYGRLGRVLLRVELFRTLSYAFYLLAPAFYVSHYSSVIRPSALLSFPFLLSHWTQDDNAASLLYT